MTWNYEQLEADIRKLIMAIGILSPSESAEVLRFVDVGEYGVAFEELCGILGEEGKLIPDDCKADFKSLADRMGIDQSWWESLVGSD